MGQWDQGDSWVRRSLKACPNDLMRQIVADNAGDRPTYSSPLPKPKASQPSEEPQDRSGWRDAQALKSPDGVSLVDQLVDQQDLLDFAARARELAAASGLSYGDWLKLTEQQLRDRRERREKADKARKETPK
jgi:hypothetical protein